MKIRFKALLMALFLFVSFVPIFASAQVPVRDMPFLPGQRIGISQGNNGTPSHSGNLYHAIDFVYDDTSAHGMPVVAVFDGVVNSVFAGMADFDSGLSCNGGWGNAVVYCGTFRAASGDQCERAAHLREVFVVPGEKVKAGQVIGLLGTSGESDAPHLHSQRQTVYTGVSVASKYYFTLDGDLLPPWDIEEETWIDTQTPTHPCYTSPTNPCAISVNEGMMGDYANGLDPADKGDPALPHEDDPLEANEGWNGYGWYSHFEYCEDSDGDRNTNCPNEDAYRKNAYIRRFSGGNWHDTVIVYDALSGATEPYVVRSGFLNDGTYGWDNLGGLGGPHSYLGMPIESERSTSFGSEQYFQWGILRYTTSTDAITHHDYDLSVDADRSVGPGVFAPGGPRDVHYWNCGISYRFVDAWNRNGGASMLGQPDTDNGANEGVHVWQGTRFLIQNFDGGTYGEAAIVYDPANEKYAGIDMFDVGNTNLPAEGWNRAYLIRSGFWDWYRYNNGIGRLKAPIADEVVTSTGSKQEFLCGWLEYNSSTDQVVKHIPTEENDTARPGCNLSPPAEPADSWCNDTYTPETSENIFRTAAVISLIPNTIFCSVGPVDTLIEITGPIQDGLFAPVTGSTVYLEYGSNTDGWDPYTAGKPKKAWTTDTMANGDPKTYSMYVGGNVDEINFFMYEPATSDLEWFDLSQWRVVGDCYEDGGLIYRLGMSYPTAEGEITCTLTEDDLIVDITGPVEELLVESYVATPDEIQYGSDTDGWTVPYSSGKPAEPWTGAWTHTIVLDPDIYDFNFYLSDVDGVGGEWFDLVDGDGDGDAWTVNGDCWEDGGTITHDPPPSTIVGTITCDEIGADIHVTISGDIPAGIFGTAPTGSNKYLEYGSNAPTPGWVGYTSGKPKKTWTPTQTSYTLILGTNVNEMNWFLYKSTTGQTNWFDLSKWTVGGDCWQSGGLIYH